MSTKSLTPLPSPPIKWYEKKRFLLAAQTPVDKWIFTQDFGYNSEAKKYAWLSDVTFDSFVSCPVNNGHYYELILNLQDYPC